MSKNTKAHFLMMQTRKIKPTINKSELGATLIEAAIVFPIVMFLLFGIIQWGLIFCAQITVTNAAATGGRLVAGQNSEVTPTVTEGQIISAAQDAVDPFLVPANLNVQVTPSPLPSLGGGINTVTITCTYQYPLLLRYVVPGQSNGFLEITSTTTAR